MSSQPLLLGIDIGGTFTDFVLAGAAGHIRLHKQLTTPGDPARGLLDGLAAMGLADEPALTIVHGSTIATNALLERRGARTALITTEGFTDVLAIGRQTRPDIYARVPRKPPPLVPAKWRYGVRQRITAQGDVLTPLDPGDLPPLRDQLLAEGIESVAVSLLFGFLHPAHEQQIRAALAGHIPHITLASDLLPEYREYERTSTVVINAYVAPLMARYLAHLDAGLNGRPLRIMQSNGGAITAQVAAEQAARTALSGPAGGVVGAFHVARTAAPSAAPPNLITFDMGGTSSDVALCPGQIPLTSEGEIAGMPLRLPVIDIHTVGAGGGSLARVDAGGALQVGPESAGALPGPVCYAQGGSVPTVTDANVVLGRLPARQTLAGGLPLDVSAARAALAQLAGSLGLPTPEAAAQGVLQVANAAMERAIRHISIERGHDPRDFTMLAFGGAGPLHACDLAGRLGITRILLPRAPGVLSALGMLIADVVTDTSQTIMQPLAGLQAADLERAFTPLAAGQRGGLRAQGLAQIETEPAADLRYVGQSFELAVPWHGDIDRLLADFHRLHGRRYGHSHPQEPVEVVNLRVRGVGRTPTPEFAQLPSGDATPPAAARLGETAVWLDASDPAPADVPLYDRAGLQAGNRLPGPAIILQLDTTLLILPRWTGQIDPSGNIVVTREITT